MRNREDAASIFKKPNEKPTEMPLFDKLAKKNLDLRYWIRYVLPIQCFWGRQKITKSRELGEVIVNRLFSAYGTHGNLIYGRHT